MPLHVNPAKFLMHLTDLDNPISPHAHPDISDEEEASPAPSPPKWSDEETDIEIDALENDFGIRLQRHRSRRMINWA